MINSVSKSFAGLAVLQLVETGQVDLDAPVVVSASVGAADRGVFAPEVNPSVHVNQRPLGTLRPVDDRHLHDQEA